MRLISKSGDNFTIELPLDELATLKNSLVAAYHHMDEVEFHSRIGVFRRDAAPLLDAIVGALTLNKAEPG